MLRYNCDDLRPAHCFQKVYNLWSASSKSAVSASKTMRMRPSAILFKTHGAHNSIIVLC